VLELAAAAVSAAERTGIDSLWVSESPEPVGSATPYEPYSLLGALAVRSDRVHLGVVADGTERRPPSILAKIVTGVDVISHGRGVLALDGDATSEADAERLSEALTVCRSVLVDEHPTYAGRIYSIEDAVNRPAPVQDGGVPVVVHLHGEGPGRAALLDVAARLADAVVVDGGADGAAEACRAVGARGDGSRPDGPVQVLGRVRAGSATDGSAAAVAGIRRAGATGCLVGLPFPWDPGAVAGLASTW
jgi:alkanesulfonate monooxygenase SsuD/methylene tetrahydromethanopterin reductase-like flavin-dependent oxidoreductase (luciferase family)